MVYISHECVFVCLCATCGMTRGIPIVLAAELHVLLL